MAFTVLVLHGPNLAAVAKTIDAELRSVAKTHGATVLTVQKNGEEGLLDWLHEHAAKSDAVLVNPGVLAPTAFALAEALEQLELPCIEVLLEPPRSPSALEGVVREQVTHGAGGYVSALESLVETKSAKPAQRVGKTLGRKASGSQEPKPTAGKTLGRRQNAAAPSAPTSLTRGAVRSRITDRLKGRMSADALAQWARQAFTRLERDVEPGSKDVIEDVLLTLMLGAKADDSQLVAQLAKLQP